MRQGQQNRRGRGRGRKVQNPLSRNYESNGPSVKIRGTAAHVAEKYMALARDALAAGDNVMAENFLQHAEHYNRIIMSAQAQYSGNQQPGTDGPNGAGHRQGQQGDGNRSGDEMSSQGGEQNGGMAHGGDQPEGPQGANGSGQHLQADDVKDSAAG